MHPRFSLLAALVKHLDRQDSRDHLVPKPTVREAEPQHFRLVARGPRDIPPQEGFPNEEPLSEE